MIKFISVPVAEVVLSVLCAAAGVALTEKDFLLGSLLVVISLVWAGLCVWVLSTEEQA